MAQRDYDGRAILWIEAYRRLTRAGWNASAGEDGIVLVNGKLTAYIETVDSLGSLVSVYEVDEQIWRLRRAINGRKR